MLVFTQFNRPYEKDFGMFRISIIGLITLVALSACDTSKITHRAEWDCLNSQKLYFKDPDSLRFLANLGTRGVQTKAYSVGNFWVRYKATNSFGGYLQRNMLCKPDGYGHYMRDESGEVLAELGVSNEFLQLSLDNLNNGREAIPETIIQDMVRERVYVSPDNLKTNTPSQPDVR